METEVKATLEEKSMDKALEKKLDDILYQLHVIPACLFSMMGGENGTVGLQLENKWMREWIEKREAKKE